MSSENLNRAFIKAYGKSKPGSPTISSPTVSSPTADDQDAWIVRFDTATVKSVVPQMHNQAPPRSDAELATPAHSPSPRSTQELQIAQTNVPQRQPDSSTVVQSLSPWQISFEDDLSSYLGNSTMVVPQVDLVKPLKSHSGQHTSNPFQTVADSSGGLNALETDADITKPPQNAQPVMATPAPFSQSSSSQAKFDSSNYERPDSAEHPTVGPGHTQPVPVDKAAEPRLFQPTSVNAADLEQRIAAKNKSGDIFRLDRPSYEPGQMAVEQAAEDELSSPSEASSLTAITNPEVLQATSKPESREPFKGPSRTVGERDKPLEERQKAIAKELDLRQARVRIFNPLWEVDRLEWPPVCIELLKTIDTKSSSVAKNLLNACQDGLQILAVTSPQTGAGTSTVACCLAMIAGKHGLNIALVDGNLDNPSLCYQTNLELEVDWHEALAHKMPLEEIAIHSVDDQVTLVPLLARLSAPQLDDQSMATMLNKLSESFDLVVVDLGHMASNKNMVSTLGDLGVINAVVTVIDRRKSSSEQIESCLRQIRQTGIASIGLVENFAA